MNMQEINAYVAGIFLSQTDCRQPITLDDAAANLRMWKESAVDDIPEGLTPALLAAAWNSCCAFHDGALPADYSIIHYVRNASGTPIDYDSAVQAMDDDIREDLSAELAPCTDQEFFTAYEAAHLAKHGEPWFLSAENPTW